jgi:predicted DNA-binding protein YlxM (UPF0122 family)
VTNPDIFNAVTLSEKQLSAIPLIIAARSMTEAAEKIGISRNTLYEWQKIPAFKAELQRQTDMVVEEALERLKLNVVKAVDVFGEILDNPNIKAFYKRDASLDVLKLVMKTREQSKITQLERKVSDLEKKLSERTAVQPKVKQA